MKLLIGILLLPYLSFAGYKYHSENLTIMDIESIERIVSKNLGMAEKALNPEAVNMNAAQDVAVPPGEGKDYIKHAIKLILHDQNKISRPPWCSTQSRPLPRDTVGSRSFSTKSRKKR